MGLFLVEAELSEPGRQSAATVIEAVAAAYASSGGTLVEAQVPAGHERVYLILEGDDCAGVVLDAAALPGVASITEAVPVRIVGATVEQVRERGAGAGYLVEWDIPAEVTMEQYLARKKEKSPLYDTLDDVSFLRTYVREDTQKCLCFYDAQDEAAVRNAREVVSTPISRLQALDADAVVS
ncbi:DUF4242 domain-containing protein [Microbacterium pseudoresistens]|uniref:Replication-associated recombination protein RarA n=1 Tax=Microbacterium pseudoresistens TaxID=640634 RepID=A0A7Y9EUZ6_9MICO|nr:DUF4242 domain-containing protein [Microbacterium pseudoresistens]NYD54448.1 replication-associated recombination protein RarA [Microbacterium pseudoresistens]